MLLCSSSTAVLRYVSRPLSLNIRRSKLMLLSCPVMQGAESKPKHTLKRAFSNCVGVDVTWQSTRPWHDAGMLSQWNFRNICPVPWNSYGKFWILNSESNLASQGEIRGTGVPICEEFLEHCPGRPVQRRLLSNRTIAADRAQCSLLLCLK